MRILSSFQFHLSVAMSLNRLVASFPDADHGLQSHWSKFLSLRITHKLLLFVKHVRFPWDNLRVSGGKTSGKRLLIIHNYYLLKHHFLFHIKSLGFYRGFLSSKTSSSGSNGYVTNQSLNYLQKSFTPFTKMVLY